MSLSMKIESNDIVLGEIDWFDVYKSNDFFLILLRNVNFYQKDLCDSFNELVNIKRINSEHYVMSFNIIDKAFLSKEKDIVIKASLESWINYRYAKAYSDILYSWNNNDTPLNNWRNLSKEKRSVWLDLCYDCYGIKRNILQPVMIVNGMDVKDISSLYCSLGEAFFGNRGYVGCNLDSFDDCLIDIKHPNATIVFNDMNLINIALNTNKNYLKYHMDYTTLLFDILTKHQIKIKCN